MATSVVETYRGEVITADVYRKCFAVNGLPNLYTAMLYFQQGDDALAFFRLAETIYHDWQRFFEEFLEPFSRPSFVSTDVVFALAGKLLGAECCIFDKLPVPRFVHMKSRLQNWPETLINNDENWLRHVPITLSDDWTLKIGRYRQYLPLHYQSKDFLTDEIIQTYERRL